MKKVAYYTLGCKLNFSETSTMGRMFAEKGYNKVDFKEKADVYVINTCSVTDTADKKCRYIINKASKLAPEATIIVNGCYAQLKGDEIAKIPGVDLVLGAENKFDFFDFLDKKHAKEEQTELHACEIDEVKKYHSAYSLGDRTRSFLKVQDGCNYPCTYCTIPLARGKSRSNSIEGTINEAKEIAAKGFHEIVLTGVNIGDFGRGNNENFFNLVKELDKVKNIERFRISSIEPNLLKDEIIEYVAKSSKFVPHFHIPLQSGTNKILQLMKRRYNRELFERKIKKINELIPEAFIGIDLIVGFPGETEEDFNETYRFLESMDIAFLHVFSYSIRKNTPAAEMKNQVQAKEIKRRSDELHKLSDLKHAKFYQRFVNTHGKVLWEQQKVNGKMYGFTQNYLKVETTFDESLVNTITEVELTNLKNKTLFESLKK